MFVIRGTFMATMIITVVDVILLFYLINQDTSFTIENVAFMVLVFFIANYAIARLVPGSIS